MFLVVKCEPSVPLYKEIESFSSGGTRDPRLILLCSRDTGLLCFVPSTLLRASLPPRRPISVTGSSWLSSCLHSLSFFQSKTSSFERQKNFEEKIFGISKNQNYNFKKFKIEIEIISFVQRDKRKQKERV